VQYIDNPTDVSVPNLHHPVYIRLLSHFEHIEVLKLLLFGNFFVHGLESFVEGLFRAWFKPPSDVNGDWLCSHFFWQRFAQCRLK
jgi:hypothetical protein